MDTVIALAGDGGTSYTSYRLENIGASIEGAGSDTNKIKAISSALKSLSWSALWTPWSIAPTNQRGEGARLILPYHKYASVSELKEDLGDVQIVYKLSEPITYDLTAIEVLETLKGMNNIWSDANGETAVTYRADTKLYIDNKITQAIAAALNA